MRGIQEDTSFGMNRTEVICRSSKAHLGHVFNDINIEGNTRRFCINSAAVMFIPKDKLKENGLNELNILF